MLNFFILLAVLLFAAYLTNYFLCRSFLGSKWRLFVAPGVVLHELSHALACVITGAKVVKISFFDKDGGSVKHQPSFIPIIGPVIISLAPLAIGILVFFLLAKRIQLNNSLDLSAMYFNFKTIILAIDWKNWLNIVIIYLLLSVLVTMTPSWQDLRNMLIPVIIIIAVFYLLIRFTSFGFSHLNVIFLQLSPVLNMVIFLLLAFLILSFILYAFSKMVLGR